MSAQRRTPIYGTWLEVTALDSQSRPGRSYSLLPIDIGQDVRGTDIVVLLPANADQYGVVFQDHGRAYRIRGPIGAMARFLRRCGYDVAFASQGPGGYQLLYESPEQSGKPDELKGDAP